jgi:hypothetical protein
MSDQLLIVQPVSLLHNSGLKLLLMFVVRQTFDSLVLRGDERVAPIARKISFGRKRKWPLKFLPVCIVKGCVRDVVVVKYRAFDHGQWKIR